MSSRLDRSHSSSSSSPSLEDVKLEMEPIKMSLSDVEREGEDVHEGSVHLMKSASKSLHSSHSSEEAIQKQPNAVSSFLSKWGKWIFCLIFLGYTIATCIVNSNRDTFTEAIPVLVIFIIYLLKRIGTTFREPIKNGIRGPYTKIHARFETKKMRRIFLWTCFVLFFIAIMIFVGILVADLNEPLRLVGFAGICLIYIIASLASKHRKAIRARPIVVSFMMQFTMGLLVMRTQTGYDVIAWISDTMSLFLGYLYAGSSFVFGADMVMLNPEFAPVIGADGSELWAIAGAPTGDGSNIPPTTAPANTIHYFAFMVIPAVIYVGAFTSMMYHAELLQPLIKGIGYMFGGLLGTTTPESVNAAGNIFLGQTEAPLLVKPFIGEMSPSEIHAVMVGGFATVSGSIMAAYMGVGIPAGHLIASVVMSSAGSLGMSKLIWPETNPEKLKKDIAVKDKLRRTLYGNSHHTNFIEAAAAGASDTIGLALNIGAMLIAFLSIIACANAFLNWACWMVDITGPDGANITIEFLLGYVFAPLVYCMGVTIWREALLVGQLIGLKLMATEMTAYIKLGEYIAMTETCNNGLPTCDPDLVLSEMATTFASYALCGFGNFGSVGILIGGLTPLAPEKRKDITSTVSRALIGGTLTNLLVATIAVIVVDPARTFR